MDNSSLLNSIAINIGSKNGEIFVLNKNYSDYTVGEQSIAFRNGFISDEYPTYVDNSVIYNDIPETEVEVLNLFLKIENFDLIKDYNPKILFTRYKPKNLKKRNNHDLTLNYNSKSGYKINLTTDEMLRPNRIQITSGETFVDFGQEYYFKAGGKPRGYKNNMKELNNPIYKIGYIYFELRVTITIDGKEYISKPMKRFRLECRLISTSNRIIIKEI